MFDLTKLKLMSLYLEDPCASQPSALWKTFDFMNAHEVSTKFDEDYIPSEIIVYNDDFILNYWNEELKVDLNHSIVKNTSRMMIHEELFTSEFGQYFTIINSFFRLKYTAKSVSLYPLRDGYAFKPVNLLTDLELVAEVIGKCYENIKPKLTDVINWTKRSVFRENLWVWVWDTKQNHPAGLGIAEYDSHIREGDLDWIQVLPEYRNQGLGKVIVTELLARLTPISDLITVSGEVHNLTKPEDLYRSCGFEGNDIWLLLQRKN